MRSQDVSPLNIQTRNASCGCGGTVRPDLAPDKDPNNLPSSGRTPDQWFDTTAATAPKPCTFGNLGHYSNHAPGLRNVDFSLFKGFPVTERYKLQLRWESFNLANHPAFRLLNVTQGDSNFGRVLDTLPASGLESRSESRLKGAVVLSRQVVAGPLHPQHTLWAG